MKKINVNKYLHRKKVISLPEILNEANKDGCKCSIEDITENLWSIYK